MHNQTALSPAALVALCALVSIPAIGAENADIPRTASGLPDLSGTYDVATLTPLERNPDHGENLHLTKEEAAEIAAAVAERRAGALVASDPGREAPPQGGDGSPGPAGNVGGYNDFWLDYGSGSIEVDGKFRTSLIVDPPNGRLPELTPEAAKRRAAFFALFRKNEGLAWWMKDDVDAPGPYDDPEIRPMEERCVLAFGSVSGPPMLPSAYNNLKTIVQTEDYVAILVEMVHDARIIRLNSEHLPEHIRFKMGDSIGWWEGDTLVVDTTNFDSQPGMYIYGASDQLHVVERFTRVDRDTLTYGFEVEDAGGWTDSWRGEYPWPATDDQLYEYACAEGNYALGNILRGARLLEQDVINAAGGGR